MVSLKNILLGKPLKNSDIKGQKLSRMWGLPIMASDAVSSVAYAGEEILLVLAPVMIASGYAEQTAFKYVPFVTLPIILLLLILIFSYSQIIDHYPNGGGAYIVSKENLGKIPSILAASSLVVDYILTVAVSISSASAAIASAFPIFDNFKVIVSLIFLSLITLGNLRGLRDSSKLFGLPTYIFIVSMGIMIVVGLVRVATGTLRPVVYTPGQLKNFTDATAGIGIAVLLKAFASGCSALTGVEAVSNAVPNFRDPSVRNAKNVLYMLGAVIFFIFGGTTLLEMKLKVLPANGVTVTSQIANAVFGNTFMYYIIQIFTALILILAANTAYNGLPLLLSILAHDNFVPRQFSHRGTKLSFSNGIMLIFFAASVLIIISQSDVHRLIPVYSIGVFVSFTLSQYGMFRKWFRTKAKGWQYKSWINGFGALVTCVGCVVVFVNKFMEGAWMLAIAIPVIMIIMIYIEKHYAFVGKQLELKNFYPYYDDSKPRSNSCIVLVQSINKSLLKSLNYANTISKDIIALHICRHPEHAKQLREQWESLKIPVRLKIILTPYQDIIRPFDEYIWSREKQLKHGENLSVIIIKFVSDHWYDAILHSQTTYFMERILSKHKNVTSIIMPFHANPEIIHRPDDVAKVIVDSNDNKE